MSDINWIRPGIEFDWHGVRSVIRQVGAHVLITRLDGSRPSEVPAADIARALRGHTAPLDLAHLHDIEERLTERARARLRTDSDLLHIMLTGRRADQPDSDRPPADLDPERVPEAQRRRTLARILAAQARENGKRKGYNVLMESEIRRLQRIMHRWRHGQNLLDGRYRKPRMWRTEDAVIDLLLTFMNDHAPRSTKSDIALVRAFTIYCATEQPELVLPSITTLRRRVKEMRGGWAHLGASAKNRISQLNVPASSGMTRLATRPGELVLFDTTKSNVWVKDPRTGKMLRLDITLAIDLATRCIVGIAITHTTTQFAIGLCLADVLRPKTAALASEWASDDDTVLDQPFIGRPAAFVPFYSAAFHPEGVVVDNGKQYVSTYVTAQMARLGIHYEPQRSYSPTDKAQVERVFRTIKDMFEALMPGFAGGSVHEKGANPQGEQLMTPAELERRLRQCIDLYNHRTHEGLVLPEDPFVRLSPYTMYGILAAKVGAIADIEYEFDWVRFLPSVTVKISPSRVRVRRLNYKSPILRELQGDPVVMSTGKLRVFYDPFDLRITWCFDADGTLHPLRWHYLNEHTPRFGEYHTNHVVEQFGDTKVSVHDTERILLEIFLGKHDHGTPETIRHEELSDPLMQARAADLTENDLEAALRERPHTPTSEMAATATTPQAPADPSPVAEQPPLATGQHDPAHAQNADTEVPPVPPAPRVRRGLRPWWSRSKPE